MKTKAVSKLHPWKETRQPRGIRFTDSEWDAIMKAARAAKTTPSDWLRGLAAKAIGTLTLLVVLFASCGGRTDLLEEDDVGGKQPLWIPLAGGVATDIDDKLVPVGRALDITNMQIDQQGKLVKRFGHTQLSSSGISSGWQLASYKGNRVSLSDRVNAGNPQAISTYSPTKGAWTNTATDRHSPMTVGMNTLPTSGGTNQHFAVGGGYIFLVYQDLLFSTTKIHFDVFDQNTRQVVSTNTFSVTGTLLGLDVVFCNGFAVAITSEGGGTGIVFHTMTPSSFSISTTTYAVAIALGSSKQAFDSIVKDATTISVVYQLAAGNLADAVDFVPSTLTTTGWSPRNSAAATINVSALSWMIDLGASGKMALVTSSAAGVFVQWDIPASGATRQAVTTYNADLAVVNVDTLEGHTTSNSATGEFQVVYNASGVASVVKMSTRVSGVLTPGFVLFRSLSLSSKAFTFNGDFYALFCFPSTTDGNSYVMRFPVVTSQPATCAPQAIFGVGTTGISTTAFGQPPTVVVASGTTFLSVVQFLDRVNFSGTGSTKNTTGASLVTIKFIDKFDPTSTGIPVEAFDGLVVPGGAIGHFDGLAYGELGFAYQPPQPAVGAITGAVGGGSLTLLATYWYSFVFSRMDGQGRIWRSAPSVPQFVALTGAQNQAVVPVPTLRVTGYSNIFLEIYRGAAFDSEEFQLVAQLPNDLTVDSINFTDQISDVSLANGEPLYTNGGILPNTTIPGSPFVFTFQGRLCFISGDDPTQLWFSNIISPRNGVRFNTQNVVRFSDERGGLYGAAAMDDKVVAFKQSALYAFNGEGPDDAGNGSFSTPQLIALGVGSTQPRSIVPDKDGIYFMSTARQPGIQKISRGLSLAQDKQGMGFGGAVQRYATETIMSSVLVPEQSQARFYCQSGRVLVYDLVAQLWTTFQLNLAGDQLLSAIALNGAALIASNGFNLFAEDTAGATYFDGNSIQGIYTVTITTPWIEFSAIKGFGRLSELIGTGKTVADHTLNASMYTDFDDNTIVNAKSWAETVALTPKWNWEWIPRVQRMSAAKITLSETSTAAGFQVEGITAWVGIKPGLARQPTTTRGP